MAIACLRLFTFPPCPFLPRLRVPCFRRRIALSTLLPAFFPYLRPPLDRLRPLDRFLAAIAASPEVVVIRFHARQGWPRDRLRPSQDAFQRPRLRRRRGTSRGGTLVLEHLRRVALGV